MCRVHVNHTLVACALPLRIESNELPVVDIAKYLLHSDRANGRPVPSGRNRHVKGSFALEPRPPCAGRPAPHLDKGVGVMEEMCKAQVAMGAGSKMAPRDRASAL